MTIKQLKEKLSQFPDNMDVFVAERKTAFAYGLVNSAYTKEIRFSENEFTDDDEEEANGTLAYDTVVVLDEE